MLDTAKVSERTQWPTIPTNASVRVRAFACDSRIWPLGLIKVRNTRVGSQFQRGISGGEKKRLSVGCELITDPSTTASLSLSLSLSLCVALLIRRTAGLIFLDEPTTGLDAFNSLCIMEMLNDLCNEGRTIVWYVCASDYERE